ncbi:placenta-specific protein 8 protein-like [Cichlidogyrus casuarinus]|uniref:Placenta-specific protein 8 protein-like n=1 Tax=Cichlidogyrus casuarinus TaxID=1844966 RepID=A0ABD2QMR2_9PLAT
MSDEKSISQETCPSYEPVTYQPQASAPAEVREPLLVASQPQANLTNVNQVTVIAQPAQAPVPKQNYFSHSLCECGTDTGNCLFVGFCYPCAFGEIWQEYGNCCLSYVCIPGALTALRAYHRGRYDIPGTIFDDHIVSLYCSSCVVCQLRDDIKQRKQKNIF